MYTIDPQKQTEVLRWLMFAWDGQWQARALALYGPVEASRLGARVRSAFGKVEMKAMLSLVGKERAVNLADAANLLETYFNFVWGERSFQGRFLPTETAPNGLPGITVQVRQMTALESLKKAAHAAGEDPSLSCEMLWSAWLETLLPDTQIQVTARLGDSFDQFQIDNLGDALPNPVPFPGREVAPPAGSRTIFPAMPDEADFEESPIAAALQIPIERVAPGITGELNQPAGLNGLYAGPPPGAANPPPPPPPDSLRYSPAPSQTNLFSSQQLTSQHLIGASEPGADQNLMRRGGTGGLTSRLQQKAETPMSHAQPSETPVSLTRNVTPQPVSLPPIPDFQPAAPYAPYQNDPATGRPLFSTDPEEEARSKVLRSKNLPLMSRLFMGKEARDLIDRGKDEPMVQLTSVAEKVDFILQRRLAQVRMANPGHLLEPVRVTGGPDGTLEILIGNRRFSSIDQVPPSPILEIIRQSVEEYSQSS